MDGAKEPPDDLHLLHPLNPQSYIFLFCAFIILFLIMINNLEKKYFYATKFSLINRLSIEYFQYSFVF